MTQAKSWMTWEAFKVFFWDAGKSLKQLQTFKADSAQVSIKILDGDPGLKHHWFKFLGGSCDISSLKRKFFSWWKTSSTRFESPLAHVIPQSTTWASQQCLAQLPHCPKHRIWVWLGSPRQAPPRPQSPGKRMGSEVNDAEGTSFGWVYSWTFMVVVLMVVILHYNYLIVSKADFQIKPWNPKLKKKTDQEYWRLGPGLPYDLAPLIGW